MIGRIAAREGSEQIVVEINDPQRFRVEMAPVNGAVKKTILVMEGCEIAPLCGVFEPPLNGVELRDVGAAGGFHEPAYEIRIEQQQDVENVAQKRLVDRAHACAAIGQDHDQSLAFQPLQCFPDRVGADAIARGQVSCFEMKVRRQTAGDDVVTDQVLNAAIAGTWDIRLLFPPICGFNRIHGSARVCNDV